MGGGREAFGLGSPAIAPMEGRVQSGWRSAEGGSTVVVEGEMDREATAALLMLNCDRRSWGAVNGGVGEKERKGGGMSVRHLLSG